MTLKDADGHYYMTGDGIFSDWSVAQRWTVTNNAETEYIY